jgi:transcriptional regulator with XRE-family HTH domain
MTTLNFQIIGSKLLEKRGSRGVREVAGEIGISPATLSRVERGHLPDLETFGKVCQWLGLDPNTVLGTKTHNAKTDRVKAMVHFRKDKELRPETAEALGKLILAAQRALASDVEE